MSTVIIKRHYDTHPRLTFNTEGPSLTHQSMADECDINKIMQRWQKTGVIEHRNTFEGQYGDFTETPQDYHESMNAVLQANEMFSTLPSSVRRRFANDPGLFLDFVADPKNGKELVEMGLATAAQLAKPDDAVIDDPTPPTTAQKPPKTPPKTPQVDT